MKKIIYPLILCALAHSAVAAEYSPNVVVAQVGGISNHRVEGSLEAGVKLDCIALNAAKNTNTPPELYEGVKVCVAQKEFRKAADLFVLAGMYSRFDAQRVTDQTAGQARTVLIQQAFAEMAVDDKEAFLKWVDQMTADSEQNKQECQRFSSMDKPNYFPKYMVLHGMQAFLGDPYKDALDPALDTQEQWQMIRNRYLNCSK